MDARVAVITGAGTGIGAETARLLAARGQTIVLVGRRRELLEEVARSLPQGRGIVVPADLADPGAPAAIVEAVRATAGRLDVLVNNAAAFVLKPFGSYELADVEAMLDTNVRAPFFLVQEALPLLEASPAAVVVNISSAAAVMYRPNQAAYGLAKAAVEHLTKQLAAELASRRIRVVGVRPGPVDTPLYVGVVDDPAARMAQLGKMVPLGRVGRAEEIARWIGHLVEPEAEWVTGAIVAVDGGRVLGPPEVS
jgi:NAD(P)-dependent dehydrogenase (short-subunit alcohol dehydrogenase family)